MDKSITNPYAAGTANSSLFRIPSIFTLRSGRIIAGADIRYGDGTDDPANIETAVRYSDDNGRTWSAVNLINHFEDMEDCDHNVAIPSSASFIDSAICEGEDNEIFHVCDACPAFMGLWSAGTVGKGNGYIDGKIALCDKTRSDGAESTALTKENYPYYIDDFGTDGYAPVLKYSDNSSYEGYCVDKGYYIYKKENGKYSPVLIKQMNKDGTLSDRDITANTFYAHSPLKMYPTYYLWVKKSLDGGETWGDGTIINTQINSRGFTGFSPGRGICVETEKGKRVIFTVYDNNDKIEYTSAIFTEDGGKSWHRGEKANKVGSTVKSSESQLVLLNNNILRMYSRNCIGHIGYCDSLDFGETFGKYTVEKDLPYCGNCMFSVINYSKKLDGKSTIIISYPSMHKRKCGMIKVGLYGEDNKVDWTYNKCITKDLNPFTFVYSCLTEDCDGNILDLYESFKAEISLVKYSIDELCVKENSTLSLLQKIESFFKNKKK